MNQIAPLQAGGVPSLFQSMANLPDMAAAARAGISAGFAVVGYKGRNWRLKYAGEDELLKDERGVPFATLDVVIVGISPNISKIWYEKRFVEGDDAAPDCWSVDGITPDVSAPKRQASVCAQCPRAVWGSRITDAGKKGKECQDSRRIAVVPHGDIVNEGYGGPMLLRIPPMSLGNLGAYAKEISRFGAQPFMVRTQLGFNYDVAYPEITFRALGWLDSEDAEAVIEQMQNPLVERILHDEAPATAAAKPTQPPGADTSALSGGPPTHLSGGGAAPGPSQADLEREKVEAQAKAQIEAQAAENARLMAELERQKAELEAKLAQARAPAAAPAATLATTSGKKASPFGAKTTPGVAAKAAQTATIPIDQRPAGLPGQNFLDAPVSSPAVVSPAPTDMEAAINALLD